MVRTEAARRAGSVRTERAPDVDVRSGNSIAGSERRAGKLPAPGCGTLQRCLARLPSIGMPARRWRTTP